MSRFLTDQDYKRLVQPDIFQLNPVLATPSTLQAMEATAIEEMKAYLQGRYDTHKIFQVPRLWLERTKYVKDEYVWIDGVYYLCLQDHIHRPPTAAENAHYWKQTDPRSNLVIMHLIDIVLYHASTVGTVRDTPTVRDMRYQKAIKWLEQIRDDQKSTLLPRLSEEENTPTPYLYAGTQYESDF